jgi:hypothetical protein
MERWTIKQLKETDDITFAMSILSERLGGLNVNAPLAKKLQSARSTLDNLRGGCPLVPPNSDMWGSMRERIYREMQDYYTMDYLRGHIENENHDLCGLTAEQVLADGEIMDRILHRYEKCESNDWDNMEYAIENGIKEILATREGG